MNHRYCRICEKRLSIKNCRPTDWRHRQNICRECKKKSNKYYEDKRKRKILKNINAVANEFGIYKCRKCNVILDQNNWRKNDLIKHWKICKNCPKENLKKEIMDIYGGKCTCCGELNYIFLTIDHIDGFGSKERKKLFGRRRGGGGNTMYRWLKQRGYPKDNYQILCFNCNFAKHVLGTCPHQTKK